MAKPVIWDSSIYLDEDIEICLKGQSGFGRCKAFWMEDGFRSAFFSITYTKSIPCHRRGREQARRNIWHWELGLKVSICGFLHKRQAKKSSLDVTVSLTGPFPNLSWVPAWLFKSMLGRWKGNGNIVRVQVGLLPQEGIHYFNSSVLLSGVARSWKSSVTISNFGGMRWQIHYINSEIWGGGGLHQEKN